MRIFLAKATKFLTALLLLPLLPPVAFAIWKHASGLSARVVFLENPLSLCLVGIAIWITFALLFHPPPRLYVLAHELTHAIFILLCGGSVKKISVKEDSGFVLSDKTNFLIVLAPYLFPFYSVVFGLVCGITALFVPLAHWQIPMWVGIGLTLGYHWTMTARMLTTRQSDFESQGYFFSFVLIILTNLVLMLLLFLLLPTPAGFGKRAIDLWHSVAHSYATLFQWLRHAWR